MTVCKFLSSLFADCAIRKIRLVSTENFYNIWAGMSLDLLQPVLYVVIRALFCAVVSENDSHSSFIVCLSDSAESFLASSIPYLKLYTLPFDLDSLDLEVNSYGWHVGQWNIPFRKPEQDATLTDVGITYNNQLNEVVVGFSATAFSSSTCLIHFAII